MDIVGGYIAKRRKNIIQEHNVHGPLLPPPLLPPPSATPSAFRVLLWGPPGTSFVKERPRRHQN